MPDPDYAVLPSEEMARIGKLVADELPEHVKFTLVLVACHGEGKHSASTVGCYAPEDEGQLLVEVGTNLIAGKCERGGTFDARTGELTRVQ